MKANPTSAKSMADARLAFDDMLVRQTSFPDWEGFFAHFPYVLSPTIALALQPDCIVHAAGRPDLIIYPQPDSDVPRYGALEFDAEAVQAVAGGRARNAQLAPDADSAFALLKDGTAGSGEGIRHANRELLCLGNRDYVFFVFGLQREACDALASHLAKQDALPSKLHLLPFSDLSLRFRAKVRPLTMILAPSRASTARNDPGHIILPMPRNPLKNSNCG